MSTILNSRARICCISALLTALMGAGWVSCCKVPAPDSPRPTRPTIEARPPTIDRSQLVKPVKLVSVSVVKLDEKLAKMAGRNFLKTAKDPLAIRVRVAEQIDPTPRASSPAIVLNGNELINTRLTPTAEGDELVAFLPDRRMIKQENTIAVVWLGNETLTLTKRPLIFKITDVPD